MNKQACTHTVRVFYCTAPWLVFLVPAGALGQASASAGSSPTDSQPVSTQPATGTWPAADDQFAPLIRPAPTNEQQASERLQILRTRMAEVIQANPAASAPESQPAAGGERSAAQRFYAVLALYENELNRW